MAEMKLYGHSDQFYLANHPDYPILKLYDGFPHIEITSKTKQKHMKKILKDEGFVDELSKIIGVENSHLANLIEENVVHTKVPSICPYKRLVGGRVYEALGGYDHPFRSILGVWLTEAQAIFSAVVIPLALIGVGNPESLMDTYLILNAWCAFAGTYFGFYAHKQKKNGEIPEIV
jgi:hypothetical protein